MGCRTEQGWRTGIKGTGPYRYGHVAFKSVSALNIFNQSVWGLIAWPILQQ